MNTKVVYDITKFTHLDYPDHLSCIVWFIGCNMRCDFCYNVDIVNAKDGTYSKNDVLEFLKSRINLLDSIVISGGEATSHELKEFCIEVKKLGFMIKLDTNGTNPQELKELIELKLIDFVALDYKAPKDKFTQISHSNKYKEFSQTLDFLINNNYDYEIRTTLHNDLLNVEDINLIINDLTQRGYNKTYYLQKFLETNNIGDLKNSSKEFNKELLSSALNIEWR